MSYYFKEIKNDNPVKGTETFNLAITSIVVEVLIKNDNPVKGTETER